MTREQDRTTRAVRILMALSMAVLVAACTAQETMTPVNGTNNNPVILTPQAPRQPNSNQDGSLENVRVQFAPIVGSTLAAVTPLSRRISQRARETGLTITRSNDPARTHLVKGYFSAIAENGQTTIIYVWDILDAGGERLHRIQGQETAPPGSENDAWSAVPSAKMEAIADRLMNDLVQWLSTARS